MKTLYGSPRQGLSEVTRQIAITSRTQLVKASCNGVMMRLGIKKSQCKAAYCSGTCRVSSSLTGVCNTMPEWEVT